MSSMLRPGLIGIAAVVAGTIACVGGGGSLGGELTTWEPTASSTERAETSGESAPASQDEVGSSIEPGAGGGPGAAFDCSGTFSCKNGDGDFVTFELTLSNGNCAVPRGDLKGLTFGSDGTLSVNGKKIGSWQVTGSGFTASSGDGSITCTRTKGGATTTDDSNPPTNPSGGSGGSDGAGPPPTLPMDAG
jgi:hypothetical protein